MIRNPLTRESSVRGFAFARKRNNFQSAGLLLLLQVPKHFLQVAVELSCMSLAQAMQFCNDRIGPHGSRLQKLIGRANRRQFESSLATEFRDLFLNHWIGNVLTVPC